MRVLIVEDEQAAREGLVDIIDWGALGIDEIYTAPNGHRGLIEAKKHRPDILLTDIRMPVMDGVRMAGEIVKLYPECSILFLTAYAEIGYYREAIKLKAVSYVEKPVTPGQLKEAVARAVVEHRNRTSVQKLLKEQDRERVSRAAACLLREGMTRDQEQELIRLLGITKEAAAWGIAFLVQAEGDPELWERMAACLEEEAEAAQMRLACVKKDAGITVFFLLGRFAPSGATRELFCDKIADVLRPCARYGIAVGESVEGLRRVFASYQTAACLLQLGFYEPRGRVMLPRDGAAGPGGRRYTGEKSQILGAIDSLDRSRTEALEEELYRALTAKRDAFPEHVRELYAAFFFSLDRQRELTYGQNREKPKQWDKVPAMNLEELHRVYREMAGELFADRGEGGQEQPTVRMILSSHQDAEEIGSIRIYTEEDADLLNGAPIPEEEPVFAPFTEIRYNYWTNLMKIRGENRAVFSGYYLTDQERDHYGSLSFVNRMTYYRDGEEREAYIVIYHDITMLRGILEAAVNLPGESAYLVDGQNIRVVFTDANDLGVRTVDYEKLDEVYGGGRDFERLSLGLGRQYFRYQDVPNSDWRLEWVVPEDSLARETRGLLTQFVIQYSVILVFAFLLGMLVSRSILNRLYYLKKQMHFVREQRPVPVAGEYGRDIVGELIETYNDMTEKINAQIDKELKINGELYEYRLQALRAQIDPHFLYNTLDMIKWLAKKGKNEEVEEMVVTLARFYRLSLNKGHANNRLGEELEQVSLYVKLMNKRFGDTIDFFIDVPEELADREIPMMVFQPIVENAIVHGILEKEPQEGSIAIVGWEDEEALHFEVADDGVGMSADLLEKIAAGEQVSSTGGGIGVKNTKRRLELLYGKEPPVLWYESRPGEGTTVHMEMRKEKETWA